VISEITVHDSKLFTIEHLYDSTENEELISNFTVRGNAAGLENYLKYSSFDDEDGNLSRTYLVKDKMTRELAGYFTLRTGLITQKIPADNDKEVFDSLPAIELSNFAVNSQYKSHHPDMERVGLYMVQNFVFPLAKCISNFVGVNALYLYALPFEKLIKHYETMGFSRLPPELEQFVQAHVKPKYDEGCIFMYQTL